MPHHGRCLTLSLSSGQPCGFECVSDIAWHAHDCEWQCHEHDITSMHTVKQSNKNTMQSMRSQSMHIIAASMQNTRRSVFEHARSFAMVQLVSLLAHDSAHTLEKRGSCTERRLARHLPRSGVYRIATCRCWWHRKQCYRMCTAMPCTISINLMALQLNMITNCYVFLQYSRLHNPQSSCTMTDRGAPL